MYIVTKISLLFRFSLYLIVSITYRIQATKIFVRANFVHHNAACLLGWYVMSYVCVYDFRVFRPRVSPFHRVHACFAAMCRKDRRVVAGSRNGEEGKG